jgi:hypothetical protein
MCNSDLNILRMNNSLFKIATLFLLLATGWPASAQHFRDTLAVIRQLNDVMAFAAQPYVYYSSTTTLRAGPMRNVMDTGMVLHGKLYKVGDDFYYGTEAEEMLVQDSLMIRINHDRKEITVQRLDMTTKKNIDLLPLKKVDMQRLLRNRYLISELSGSGDTGVITIQSHDNKEMTRLQSSEMRVEYRKENHYPVLIQITTRMRQDGTEQAREMLRSEGFDVERMQAKFNGLPCFVVNQTSTVRFDELSIDKEQAQHMPRWKEKLVYDQRSGQFSGMGHCTGYTVKKMF